MTERSCGSGGTEERLIDNTCHDNFNSLELTTTRKYIACTGG